MNIDTLVTDGRLPPRMSGGMRGSWRSSAAPGTWFTGSERVAIAAAARSSFDQPAGGSATATTAESTAAMVASNAHQIDRQTVDQLGADGLSAESYVEVVGIVARTVAVDTAIRGMGIEELEFPEPEDGTPSRVVSTQAKRRSAFVPMVGAAGATNALSAVGAEDSAQEDLHGALYLTYGEMGDLGIVRGLARWQLELVAARTSLINRCHF